MKIRIVLGGSLIKISWLSFGVVGGSLWLSSAAWATDFPQALVGEWSVRWEGATGRLYEANLTLNESGQGQWRTLASSRRDGCVGRQVPVSATPIAEQIAHLKLKFSEVLAGCSDATVKLTVGADGAVTGVRGEFPLSLKRK